MAVGVVLVFRSTRVINFAVGEMGGFAGPRFLYRLVIDWNAPFWLSLAIGIVVGALIGAALELVVDPSTVLGTTGSPPGRRADRCSAAAPTFRVILPNITQVGPYQTAFTGSWRIGGLLNSGSAN